MLSNQSHFSDALGVIDPEILNRHMVAALAESDAKRIADACHRYPPKPEIQDFLNSGDWQAALRYAGYEWTDCNRNPAPMVPANTYAKVEGWQELKDEWKHNVCRGPYRPVIMRGARANMRSNMSYFLCKITDRYVRMKIGMLITEEDWEKARGLVHDVLEKFPCHPSQSRRVLRDWFLSGPFNQNVIWKDGKLHYLSASEFENLCRLRRIIEKTDKLSERLKIARKTKRY
jgi:hypothetical protein